MAKQWNYLASEPFQMRYLLVAGLLRKFKNILEIGSYKTPVFQYIDDDEKNIIAVDPMIFEEEKSQTQRSRMIDFRCLEFVPFGGEDYALVMLGLDLPIEFELKQWIRNAKLVIIEYPEDHEWKKSRETYEALKYELGFVELTGVHMNLNGYNCQDYLRADEWPPRTQRFIKVVSCQAQTTDGLGGYNPFVKRLKELDTSNSKLINTQFLQSTVFQEAEYDFTHGAFAGSNYLGGGLLYYTIVHMLQSKVCVCIGSGGAFVPRLIRQAQRDIGMGEDSRTILIDGNMGDFGRPNWVNEDSFFRRNYADVEVMIMNSADAAKRLQNQSVVINYLHIDADHSHEGSLQDFKDYLPLMKNDSLITFHDTKPGANPTITCWKALDDIKGMGFEMVNLPFVGSGVAIIKVTRD